MSGRAAMVHSFMRGLTVTKAYPIAPFTPTRPKDAGFRFEDAPISITGNGDFLEMFETNHSAFSKYMHVVDAGLAFNSPYPLVLRQQRGVDIILSFDFSGRKHDNYPPFKELLLAYKWALIRNVPFPHITLDKFEKKGMQEVYIFRDKENPRVPIIMHFVLVNISFRQFKKPNIQRTLEDEISFANFNIFGGEKNPYSTYNFVYSPLDFDRIACLMEYNTLNCLPKIKKCIAECIDRRRKHALDLPINNAQMTDFLNASASLGVNRRDVRVLGKYISQRETLFSLNSSGAGGNGGGCGGSGAGSRGYRGHHRDDNSQEEEDEEEDNDDFKKRCGEQRVAADPEVVSGHAGLDSTDGDPDPPRSSNFVSQPSTIAPKNTGSRPDQHRRRYQRGVANNLRVVIPPRPIFPASTALRRDCPKCSATDTPLLPSCSSSDSGESPSITPMVGGQNGSSAWSSPSASGFETAEEDDGDDFDRRLNEELMKEITQQRFVSAGSS